MSGRFKKLSQKERIELRNKEIIELYKQGLSFQDISERILLGFAGITHVLKANQVRKRPKSRRIENEDVLKLFEQGKEINEIARHLNMPPHLVISIVKKKYPERFNTYSYAGKTLDFPDILQYKKEIKIQVLNMYHSEKALEEICKALNISIRQVMFMLYKNHLISSLKINHQTALSLTKKQLINHM